MRVGGIWVLAMAMLGGVEAQAAPANCKELVKYRDGALVADIDRAFRQYSAATDSLKLLKAVQKESQAVRSSQPTVQAALQVVLSLKTAAGAIGTILGLDPATGVAVSAAKQGGSWLGAVLRAGDAVSMGQALVEGKVLEHVLTESVAEQVPVGGALVGAYELAQNVMEQKEAYHDGRDVLNALDSAAAGLEKQIRQVEVRAREGAKRVEAVNRVRAAIDGRCSG